MAQAAAALTPEQQAIVALQQDLQSTRDLVNQMSQNYAQLHSDHDSLKRAHEALNRAADAQLRKRAQEIAES